MNMAGNGGQELSLIAKDPFGEAERMKALLAQARGTDTNGAQKGGGGGSSFNPQQLLQLAQMLGKLAQGPGGATGALQALSPLCSSSPNATSAISSLQSAMQGNLGPALQAGVQQALGSQGMSALNMMSAMAGAGACC
jgi:hypothetical protein